MSSDHFIDMKGEKKFSKAHGLKAEQNAERFEKALRNLNNWNKVEEIIMKFFSKDVMSYLSAVQHFRDEGLETFEAIHEKTGKSWINFFRVRARFAYNERMRKPTGISEIGGMMLTDE